MKHSTVNNTALLLVFEICKAHEHTDTTSRPLRSSLELLPLRTPRPQRTATLRSLFSVDRYFFRV